MHVYIQYICMSPHASPKGAKCKRPEHITEGRPLIKQLKMVGLILLQNKIPHPFPSPNRGTLLPYCELIISYTRLP